MDCKQLTKCKVDILPKHYHHHHVHQRTFWWVYLRAPKVSFNVKDHTYTHIYSNLIATPKNPPKPLAKTLVLPIVSTIWKVTHGLPHHRVVGGFHRAKPTFFWCLAKWHLKSDPRILTPIYLPKIFEMFGWGKTSNGKTNSFSPRFWREER